ncbi:MAG: BrnA antitoxin family protein [Gemmatimonadota bacterium]
MRGQYDFSTGKRGPVAGASSGKSRITIRLDNEVLEWFRARAHESGGGNYQSMINEALREYIVHDAEPAEDLLRRVMREELTRYRGE